MTNKVGLKLKMNRLTILQHIFEDFQQMTQWITTMPESYHESYMRAKCLIEMLETEDCGSIGGYDKENPLVNVTGFKLYDRFLTLLNKKKRVSKLEPICGFTKESLGEYFKTIASLRQKISNKYENYA